MALKFVGGPIFLGFELLFGSWLRVEEDFIDGLFPQKFLPKISPQNSQIVQT